MGIAFISLIYKLNWKKQKKEKKETKLLSNGTLKGEKLRLHKLKLQIIVLSSSIDNQMRHL